uniref:Uncharacterized protein n=1 Tax=Anguilla anguilla TaxID=7936 RepID=A0A0E9RY51_ANGAN
MNTHIPFYITGS